MIKTLINLFSFFIIISSCGCAPTPLDLAMGTGVALAVKSEKPKVIKNNSSDKIIELSIIRKLLNKNDVNFSNLNISSFNNEIILSGSVETTMIYLQSLDIIWSHPDVKKVNSKAYIHKDNRDLNLSKNILLRIEEDANINSSNFNIEISQKNIYLFGKPSTNQENFKVIRHAVSLSNGYNIITKFYNQQH